MLQPVTCLLFLLKVSLMFLVSLVVFTIHWNIGEEKCDQRNTKKFKQKNIQKRTGNSLKRAHQKESKVETEMKRKADTDDIRPLKLPRVTQQSTQNCFLSSRARSWVIGNGRSCNIINRSKETICTGRWDLGFGTLQTNMMNQVENELIADVKEVEAEMKSLVQKSFLICSCVTCDKTRSTIDVSSPSRELSCVNMETSRSNVEPSSLNMETSSSNVETSRLNVETSRLNVETSSLNVETSSLNVETSSLNVKPSSSNVKASCSAGELPYSKVETSSPASDESYVNCDVSFSNIHKFNQRKRKKKFKSSKTKPAKYWKDLFRKKSN